MNSFEIKLQVFAPDVMKATLIKEGLQNILEELGRENHMFFADFADKKQTKAIAGKVAQGLKNPLLRKYIGG